MKKLIIYLILLIFLSSCDAGIKECTMKLQDGNNIVYSVDDFNYIVIEDSTIYHYIPQSRYCNGDTYTRIIIK